MSRPVDNAPRGAQVNVLKKVRTSKGWQLCPVVREANGRLRDRVHVGGRVEVHTEGVYYLEWREDGRRLRAAVPNHAEVLERARLKSLELEARRSGISLIPMQPLARPSPSSSAESCNEVGTGLPLHSDALQLLLAGMDAYVRERVDAVLRVRLTAVNGAEDNTKFVVPPEPKAFAAPILEEHPRPNRRTDFACLAQENAPLVSSVNNNTIAGSIEAYLKDVEPPQREPKTYEEYRNVLHRFQDHCKKEYVKDVDRNDCLEFMRHLYSIGNEARTVYIRFALPQGHGVKRLPGLLKTIESGGSGSKQAGYSLDCAMIC